jgi:ATP-dependent DNA ligase
VPVKGGQPLGFLLLGLHRNGRDLTHRFPELVAAVGSLPARILILDGEIAAFDTALVSRFEWLRGRPKDETATPPMLMAFDCLYARRKDLRERPLSIRRHVLGRPVLCR